MKKQITIKDIAKMCGVGVVTVSRVINNNGYVSDALRQKIEQVVKENNFIPSHSAVTLKSQKIGIIALLIPTSLIPFFSKIAFYVEQYLEQASYKMILVNSQYDKSKEIETFNMIKSRQIDGLIFLTHHTHDYDFSNIPIVTIDRHISKDTPFVTSNNYQSVYNALQLLYDSGARRIAYVGGKTEIDSEVRQRYTAYKDFVKKHNLEAREFYEFYKHGEERNITFEFLKNNSDINAVVATSDIFALGMSFAAKELNIAVPDQLQIIAYDGAISEFAERKITSIKQDVQAMAQRAVEVLVKQIKKSNYQIQNILTTELVKGDTTLF